MNATGSPRPVVVTEGLDGEAEGDGARFAI
jgi:hypothetical protein